MERTTIGHNRLFENLLPEHAKNATEGSLVDKLNLGTLKDRDTVVLFGKDPNATVTVRIEKPSIPEQNQEEVAQTEPLKKTPPSMLMSPLLNRKLTPPTIEIGISSTKAYELLTSHIQTADVKKRPDEFTIRAIRVIPAPPRNVETQADVTPVEVFSPKKENPQ
jgi:hypothetical protein